MSVIHLHLDFETRSKLDIKRVGLDRYAKSAEVLMMAWAVNDMPPKIWLPSEGPMPEQVQAMLLSQAGIVFIAWNAAFERAILANCPILPSAVSIWGRGVPLYTPATRWIDPSAIAMYAGLPSKLKLVSEFLKLGDKAKDKDGTRLINKFSKPHKSKKLGEHFKDWNDKKHAADWLKFQQYCKQDVIAEREIFHRLRGFFALPPMEERLWELDAKINERGMPVSMPFVNNAQRIVDHELDLLTNELHNLTGLANPNSVQQLLPWLKARGYPYNSLAKEKITKFLEGK